MRNINGHRHIGWAVAYLVLPAIVGLSVMCRLSLDFRRQREEGLCNLELRLNLSDGYAVIGKGKEARKFRRF